MSRIEDGGAVEAGRDLVAHILRSAMEWNNAPNGDGPRAYYWVDKPHRELWDACALLNEAAAEITRLRAENAGMREALEEVAEPIAAIQKRAKELGAIVDGGTAVHLSSDAGYLKGIARAALSKASQAEGQTR